MATTNGSKSSAALLQTRLRSHLHPHHLDRKTHQARPGAARRGAEVTAQRVKSTAPKGASGVSQPQNVNVKKNAGIQGRVAQFAAGKTQMFQDVLYKSQASQGSPANSYELIDTKEYISIGVTALERSKADAAEIASMGQTLQSKEPAKIDRQKERKRQVLPYRPVEARPRLLQQRGSQTSENSSRVSKYSQKEENEGRAREMEKQELWILEMAREQDHEVDSQAAGGSGRRGPRQEQTRSKKRLAIPGAVTSSQSFDVDEQQNEASRQRVGGQAQRDGAVKREIIPLSSQQPHRVPHQELYLSQDHLREDLGHELVEVRAAEASGATTHDLDSKVGGIDKTRLINEIKRYQSELNVRSLAVQRRVAPTKQLTKVQVRPAPPGKDRYVTWNAYSDQGYMRASQPAIRPDALSKVQSSGPDTARASQPRSRDGAKNKSSFQKPRRSGQREYYELPVQNFDLNTFTLQRSVDSGTFKLQASASAVKLADVENKAQIPRPAAFTTARTRKQLVSSSHKSEGRAHINAFQKSKSSLGERVKAPAALKRSEKSFPHLPKSLNKVQAVSRDSSSVVPLAGAARPQPAMTDQTSRPRSSPRNGHWEPSPRGQTPDMYPEGRSFGPLQGKIVHGQSVPQGSTPITEGNRACVPQYQGGPVPLRDSAGSRQLPIRVKGGKRGSASQPRLEGSADQLPHSLNRTVIPARGIRREKDSHMASREQEQQVRSAILHSGLPPSERSLETEPGYWQHFQKDLMIQNQKILQQVFQDFQQKMAQGQGGHEAVYRRLLELPGPRDEMLSQDLYHIMEGGLVNSQKLKDFLESTQQQPDSSAFNGNPSLIETLSLPRSLEAFDLSDFKYDHLPRRMVFASCADKFTAKSFAQHPMPSAMPLPSVQELGLNTRKLLHGAKEVQPPKSSENMRAYSRGLGAAVNSSSSQRGRVQRRQLMQRKSRNELVYYLNRQLTNYTHKCAVETKRRMVAQNFNNWNERPYVAVQFRSDADPEDKVEQLVRVLGDEGRDRSGALPSSMTAKPREAPGANALPLPSQLGKAGRAHIDATSTLAEAFRKSYTLYRKGRGLMNGARNHGARKVEKQYLNDPQRQFYRTWSRAPEPSAAEKKTVQVEVPETLNGPRHFQSKENSTEQISQGIQALNELDQDLQEQRTEPMSGTPEQEYKPKSGDEARWQGGRSESPWGTAHEAPGGGKSHGPSTQGVPSLTIAAGNQAPAKAYQPQGSHYFHLDKQKKRPQNHNLSVDLRDKQESSTHGSGRAAAGDFADPDSQASSQDQKLATTLREGSRVEGMPPVPGTKVSGSGHHAASVMRSDAAPQIVATTEQNARSLAISSSGPPYAEDPMLRMYDTARNGLALPKGPRFLERRNSHSPMIDDIVHSALQEETMKPVATILGEQPPIMFESSSPASGKKRAGILGGPGPVVPQKKVPMDKRDDSAEVDTNYHNRVLIFSRNQTLTGSSQRSGADANAAQNVQKQIGGPFERESQPRTSHARRSNVPVQQYKWPQDGADNSESQDVTASLRIGSRERSDLEPMLASGRLQAAMLPARRNVLRRSETNEDLNVRDGEILFDSGVSPNAMEPQRIHRGIGHLGGPNQGLEGPSIKVPVSEMKLKIKKFQYWLAGNHHKDLEKRLRNDEKEARKMELARLKAKNRLVPSTQSRAGLLGGKRARTQLGISRAASKAAISGGSHIADGMSRNQLNGTGLGPKLERPSVHRADSIESDPKSPEHNNHERSKASRLDLEEASKRAGPILAVMQPKRSPRTQWRKKRRPSQTFGASISRVPQSKSPRRKQQFQPKQGNKWRQSDAEEDEALHLDLMVSGRSAILKVQMQAERLYQRDVLFERSQGGITTEQFSETQLAHKYNRSGSVASRLNSVQHRVGLQQTSKREAAHRQDHIETFKPYQEAGGAGAPRDSLLQTKEEHLKIHALTKKPKKNEEEQLYRSISIKSQELSQENKRKDGGSAGESQRGARRGVQRPPNRDPGSRNSPDFIDIPHAYQGAYQTRHQPNNRYHRPLLGQPMEVKVTRKSSLRGSVTSLKIAHVDQTKRATIKESSHETETGHEAAQRRQVLRRSRQGQGAESVPPASRKGRPAGQKLPRRPAHDDAAKQSGHAGRPRLLPTKATYATDTTKKGEEQRRRQDLEGTAQTLRPLRKSPRSYRGSEDSQEKLSLEVTGTLLLKELQQAKRLRQLPPMEQRKPQELQDLGGLGLDGSRRKWQSPFILKKRPPYFLHESKSPA